MNDWIVSISYIVSTLLFWGIIIGLIFMVIKFAKRKNEYNKQVLYKLDEIIHILKEQK